MEWKKWAKLASKASHAGIIRIGFEGIFSAPHRGAPLSQYIDETPIETRMQIRHFERVIEPKFSSLLFYRTTPKSQEHDRGVYSAFSPMDATAGSECAFQRKSIHPNVTQARMLTPASVTILPVSPRQS